MDVDGIQAVAGRNNILLVAPHGNIKDDMGTSEFALAVRECLDCYAVTNKRFRKGVSLEIAKGIADLYKKDVFLRPEVKALFWDRVTSFLEEILSRDKTALVLHIHGIKDQNIQKIAKLNNGDPGHPDNRLDIVIGYGQHHKNPRFTADARQLVLPMIESFNRQGLWAQAAPTVPIYSNGHKTWYCGNDRNRMNQYLFNKYRHHIQSLQIELKYTGVRDTAGRERASKLFARAVQAVWLGL